MAKSARARECESALQWLVDAGMILKARNVEIARAPLAASSSSEVFKIFGSDIGLVGARMQVPKSSLLDVSELFMGYRGIRSEQVVAQEIVAAGGAELYYWTSAAQAEVDFLLEVEGQVVPVEVKSGINKKAKSLRQFMKKYQPIAGYRFSLDRLLQTSQVTDLPIYLAGQLSRFIGKRINASG